MTVEPEPKIEDLRAAEKVVQALQEACGDEAPSVVAALGHRHFAAELGERPRAVYEALAALSEPSSESEPMRWYLQYGCMLLVAAGLVCAVIGALTVIRFLWR